MSEPTAPEAVRQETTSRLATTFGAFRSRNFGLYWSGLVLSVSGTWMQKVAEGWLVYRLTDSAFALGVVGFASLLPLAPVSLLGGVLADRMPRQRLLLFVQLGLVFPPLILAALTWSGRVEVWHVVLIELAIGALTAIDLPNRQALVVETVPPEDLNSAIGLSASGLNFSRVVGPAVAGLLVASVGEAACFAINGLSYLAVVFALLAMRLPTRQIQKQGRMTTSLVNGFKYLAHERILLSLIAMIVIVSVFIVPYQTLLPVFARDILEAGPEGLGLLTMAAGIGAVVGGLGVATSPTGNRGKLLLGIGAILSAVTVAFAISRSLVVSCATLVAVGAGVVTVKAVALTLIHQQVDDDLRGRVMSVVMVLSNGMPAAGGLAAGFIASQWSAQTALVLGAAGCLLTCLILAWRAPRLSKLP